MRFVRKSFLLPLAFIICWMKLTTVVSLGELVNDSTSTTLVDETNDCGVAGSCNYTVIPDSSIEQVEAVPDHFVKSTIKDQRQPKVDWNIQQSTAFNLRNNWEPAQDINIFWYNPTEKKEVTMGTVSAGKIFYQNSYRNHVFIARTRGGSFLKSYVVRFHNDTQALGPVATQIDMFDPSEQPFKDAYLANKGTSWLAVYPREKPIHFMFPERNQSDLEFTVKTRFVHFSGTEGVDPLLVKSQVAPEISEQFLEIHSKQISVKPRLIMFDNFLSVEEADHIVQILRNGGLKRSTTGESADFNPDRTSSTKWIDIDETPIMEYVVQRAFDVMNISYSRSNWNIVEKPQGLHYSIGQRYRMHHDFFQPSTSLGSAELLKGRNRFATFFMYLNDVEEGGETAFPDALVNHGDRVANRGENLCKSDEVLKVSPKKGRAVMWYNLLEDGNPDTHSLHEACAVDKGEKYGMNLWFWDPKRDD